MRKLLGLFLLVSMFAVQSQATQKFFGPATVGGGTAVDCTHALIYTDSAWAANVGAGNINWLCPGTYSVSANTQLFTVSGGGTSGNPFIVRCVAGSAGSVNITAPYFSNAAALRVDSTSWVTLDGNNGSCIVQNTANGTGLTYQQPSTGITVNASSNIVIEGFTIANICQHTSVSDPTGCNQGGLEDQCVGVIGGLTNVTVTNNTIHDCQTGIIYFANNGDSNIILSNNTISRTNFGIEHNMSSGTANGFHILANDITCVAASTCNWDDITDNLFHHNGIIVQPQGGAQSVIEIANNFIHDINSQYNPSHTTDYLFFDGNPNTTEHDCQIYNNIFFTTSGQNGPGGAMLSTDQNPGGCVIANNTSVGTTAGPDGAIAGTSNGTGANIKNNVVSGAPAGISLLNTYVGVASDYNDLYNLTSGSAVMQYNTSSTPVPFTTVAAWVSATSLDTNSIITNPGLSGSFVPSSNVIGTGVNLTSLGITGLDQDAPQTFGVGGSCGTGCQSRPSSGGWTMGARNEAANSVSVSPSTIAFGTVTYLTTSSGMTTTVTNSSGSTITFTGTTLSGANSGDFSKSGCSSGTLINTGTCVVTLTFTPSVTPIASETASLSIAYTGFTGSPLSVSLSGTSGILTVPPAPSRAIFTLSKEFKNENILFSSSFFGGYDPMWVPKENFRYSAYRSARSQ